MNFLTPTLMNINSKIDKNSDKWQVKMLPQQFCPNFHKARQWQIQDFLEPGAWVCFKD